MDNRQVKVLIVDDELSTLRLLRPNFERRGYQILTAWDQRAALGAVAREKPDVVALNTMMSTLQGLNVCALIRRGNGVTHHYSVRGLYGRDQVARL